MNVSRRRVTVSVLALSLASAVAQERVRYTDERHPGSHPTERGRWTTTRLVDDVTGAPIANAEVFYLAESAAPIAGEFWFTRKTTSDADGWVRKPLDGDYVVHMEVVRHADYGTSARSSSCYGIWRVGRAFDVPVQLLDWQHRPAPGAAVGFCCGCGHTPDLANATAGADGVAVLRGVDPHSDIRDLYVQHPGLALFYDSVRWFPGDPPPPVVCGYSPPATGRVLDHRGEPMVGAAVRGGGYHRGPWGRTGADGTFTILGMKDGECVHHVRAADGREAWFPNGDSYPVTVHFPDPEGDDPTEGTIDMPAKAERLLQPRMVRFRVVGGPAEHSVHCVAFDQLMEGGDESRDAVVVPTTGPCVVYVADARKGVHDERAFAFDDASTIPDPLELRWEPAVRVVGRAVDERGRPLHVTARWRERWSGGGAADDAPTSDCRDGAFALQDDRVGTHLLELVAEGQGLLPRLSWVRVPRRQDAAVLDLGDVVIRSKPQLRVVGEDGRALPGAVVGFARAGFQEVGELCVCPLRDDGAWLGPDLRAGDAVVVRLAADAVPFRAVLVGDGPWQLEVPDGRVTFDVQGVDTDDVEVTAVFGDHGRRVRNGAALRGLPKGALRCYVSAPGRRTAIVDAVVGDEPLLLRFELPKR